MTVQVNDPRIGKGFCDKADIQEIVWQFFDEKSLVPQRVGDSIEILVRYRMSINAGSGPDDIRVHFFLRLHPAFAAQDELEEFGLADTLHL